MPRSTHRPRPYEVSPSSRTRGLPMPELCAHPIPRPLSYQRADGGERTGEENLGAARFRSQQQPEEGFDYPFRANRATLGGVRTASGFHNHEFRIKKGSEKCFSYQFSPNRSPFDNNFRGPAAGAGTSRALDGDFRRASNEVHSARRDFLARDPRWADEGFATAGERNRRRKATGFGDGGGREARRIQPLTTVVFDGTGHDRRANRAGLAGVKRRDWRAGGFRDLGDEQRRVDGQRRRREFESFLQYFGPAQGWPNFFNWDKGKDFFDPYFGPQQLSSLAPICSHQNRVQILKPNSYCKTWPCSEGHKSRMMGNGDLERGPSAKDRSRSYYGGGGGGGGGGYVMEYSDNQWTSWLVPMIIVANVAMFVVIMFVNDCPRNHSGLRGDCAARLQKLGALDWNMIVHQNEAWRLVTCIWLHAGVIHLLANMLSLVFIGIRLEQQFGFVRVGLVYLLSGIGGSVLSSLFIQKSISVGASGALFGLLGAMLSELFTNWTIYSNKAAALFTLIVIIAINLAVGILPHVDNYAHIGGFMTGFLLGFVLLVRPQFGWVESQHRLAGSTHLKSKYTVYQYIFWILASLLLIVGFTVGFVMLFKGENANDKCSWCHYLSCVPTSRWSCDN
ncbi:RHOMBOID-like 2 [Striga hermonthica]|uniref:RHOMBOID-like protein n=1 Tax=Striga hermonthica TaxID=68872 RepID=A0A9N7NK69_STRHE|nr:RHOMBOID-like 2 [Striga hermonthica]